MNLKILFIFFCSSNLIFCQIKFEGEVSDSLKLPLQSASVVAIDNETNGLESYGLTDEKGKFKINLKENKVYKIQVSSIGLITINEILKTNQEDILKNYTLRADIILDEVVVKMPIVVRGDTLIYNADSFKNGSERKLEDIIDKLPGVEINDSGQIEVEGKVVNKLMVNGKDFFDGDTKIGTKNIPSNAVDKIQVLENYETTAHVEEAIHRLVEIYYKLGMEEESLKYASLLGYNYNSG